MQLDSALCEHDAKYGVGANCFRPVDVASSGDFLNAVSARLKANEELLTKQLEANSKALAVALEKALAGFAPPPPPKQ
jgi:hypothetical protein